MVKSYNNLYKSYIKHIKVYTKLLENKQKNLKVQFLSHMFSIAIFGLFSLLLFLPYKYC